MLNKPVDVLVTHRDHKNRRTIFDLTSMNAPGLPRLMNVGRLDVNSEGLILLLVGWPSGAGPDESGNGAFADLPGAGARSFEAG